MPTCMNQPELPIHELLREVFDVNDLPAEMHLSNYVDHSDLLAKNQKYLTRLRLELKKDENQDSIDVLNQFIGLVEINIDLLQKITKKLSHNV